MDVDGDIKGTGGEFGEEGFKGVKDLKFRNVHGVLFWGLKLLFDGGGDGE